MGIFAANVYIFDLESLSDVEDSFEALAVGLADIPFLLFTSVFILNKMMALFSMLSEREYCSLLNVLKRAKKPL